MRNIETAYKTMLRLERLGVVVPKDFAYQGAGRPRRMRDPYCWRLKSIPSNLSRDVA